ncbi:MAG: DUF4214 domain-containing protein [Ktedonobacteraceae bacterium]
MQNLQPPKLIRTLIFTIAVAWVAYSWTRPTRPPPNSDREYVRAVYRAVLNREPDKGGFKTAYAALKEGKITRIQLLQGFLCSQEFKNKHPDDHKFCN